MLGPSVRLWAAGCVRMRISRLVDLWPLTLANTSHRRKQISAPLQAACMKSMACRSSISGSSASYLLCQQAHALRRVRYAISCTALLSEHTDCTKGRVMHKIASFFRCNYAELRKACRLARDRRKGHFELLDHVIDASLRGGIARNINHSCDPNLV